MSVLFLQDSNPENTIRSIISNSSSDSDEHMKPDFTAVCCKVAATPLYGLFLLHHSSVCSLLTVQQQIALGDDKD